MLDFDLAELYAVGNKVLNQAVKRNLNRFPIDFMCQLSVHEWDIMWSQFVTASDTDRNIISVIVTESQKKRNVSALPFPFTEQGVTMRSGVLKSEIAINVNIAIMQAFVFLRQYAL